VLQSTSLMTQNVVSHRFFPCPFQCFFFWIFLLFYPTKNWIFFSSISSTNFAYFGSIHQFFNIKKSRVIPSIITSYRTHRKPSTKKFPPPKKKKKAILFFYCFKFHYRRMLKYLYIHSLYMAIVS
jgi:hypothetical protein